MAFLGKPYRVVYASKDFASGVSGILAHVLKPNGSVMGSFSMVALPGGSPFAGLYYFDLMTTVTDPVGEYIGMIQSPAEGIKYPFRVSFEKETIVEISEIVDALAGNLAGVAVEGIIEEGDVLVGEVLTDELLGIVECEEGA